MAVAKVEAPNLHVLVRGAGDEERVVRGDGHTQDGQLVTVQGQEELQGILEVHLMHTAGQRWGGEHRIHAN